MPSKKSKVSLPDKGQSQKVMASRLKQVNKDLKKGDALIVEILQGNRTVELQKKLMKFNDKRNDLLAERNALYVNLREQSQK